MKPEAIPHNDSAERGTKSDSEPESIRLPGLTPYEEAYRLQVERRDAVIRGNAKEAVYIVEHEPVFTLGRNAHAEHLLRSREELATMGIAVCETDRGGDITYHGPGQLVAYPILNLGARGLSIRAYLRLLESAIIDTLAAYGLSGERVDGFTGVWVDGAKVAAIGIGVYRDVSFHGIAINIVPNVEHWQWIVPCGIPNKPVTSLDQLLGTPPTFDKLAGQFKNHLAARLAGSNSL